MQQKLWLYSLLCGLLLLTACSQKEKNKIENEFQNLPISPTEEIIPPEVPEENTPTPPPQTEPPETIVDPPNYDSFFSFPYNTSKIASGAVSCLIDSSSYLWCWGSDNEWGLLGNYENTEEERIFPFLADETGSQFHGVLDIQVGKRHACALTDQNTMKCWGSNNFGQLARRETSEIEFYPKEVLHRNGNAINGFTQIAIGLEHTCALFQDKVYCWGANYFGQLGTGNQFNYYTPTRVLGLSNVAEISAGDFHSCARLFNGQVKCWGQNKYGQLGRSILEIPNFSTRAVNVHHNSSEAILQTSTKLQLGNFHSCIIDTDSKAKCWGKNNFGQLGFNKQSAFHEYPQTVVTETEQGIEELSNVQSLSGGDLFHCANTDVSVYCWGKNNKYQLGNESFSSEYSKLAINVKNHTTEDLPLSFIYQISVGKNYACALSEEQNVYCWGKM